MRNMHSLKLHDCCCYYYYRLVIYYSNIYSIEYINETTINNTYQICCGLFSCLAPNRPIISRGGSRSCSKAAADGGSLSDASGPVKCCVTGARRRWCARSPEHRSPRGAWGRNETRAQSSPSRERSCPPAHRLHPSPTVEEKLPWGEPLWFLFP